VQATGQTHDAQHEQATPPQAPAFASAAPSSIATWALSLQAQAGNQAVLRAMSAPGAAGSALLQRCAPGANCCDACRDGHHEEDEENDAARERALALTAHDRAAARAVRGPILQRVGDFEITGKFERAASLPGTIYFDLNSSALDAAEQAKTVALAAPPARALTLNGFASEEGDPAANTTMINRRIDAVAAALSAAGHTGAVTKVPKPGAGVGRIDYRRMRSVEVVPAGGASTVPDCSAGPTIPCGPAPNAFTTGQAHAIGLLNDAITATTGARTPATDALLTQFFGGPASAAAVNAKLVALKAHVTHMSAVGAHRCHNLCDGACLSSVAYNVGTGPGAVMTLCPLFMADPDVSSRAGTLIHEGAHGTAGLATEDFAYAHERLITFLSPADALRNSDSYVLFVRLLRSPGSMNVGPAAPDTLAGMTAPEETQAHEAVAWFEKWMTWSYQEIASLHATINESRTAGSWTNGYYEATMAFVAPRFGLTAPPAAPTMDDQVKAAAIHDRLRAMREVMRNRPITVTKGATDLWAPGPGSSVTVSAAFFGLSAQGRLDRLIALIVSATPGISGGREAQYRALPDLIRTHQGGGGP
jgi:outer membrane protein OmpA-like peptidoglycan-associated protein